MDSESVPDQILEEIVFFLDNAKDLERDFATAVGKLTTSRRWLINPPFLAQIDRGSPEPHLPPIILWGLVYEFEALSPAMPPLEEWQVAEEVKATVLSVMEFSRETAAFFEVELSGDIIGQIDAGKATPAVRRVLIDEWNDRLVKRFQGLDS